MKAVIAFNSFKGSLTSLEAGKAAEEGLLAVFPDANVKVFSLADGGEGTLETAQAIFGGHIQRAEVKGPLGDKIVTKYMVSGSHTKCVIEIAKICGITMIDRSQRDIMKATSYGIGEVIKNAIQRGVRRFIVGLGGSATNDGGVGMLMALGYDFLKKTGEPIELGAAGLENLSKISSEHVIPELKDCSFILASDVINPLTGKSGAAYVFGHQKGADEEQIKKIDRWMKKYATLTKALISDADPNARGAGAAGGLGFAFEAYLKARYASGADLMIKAAHIEDEIKDADFVITGEGKLDEQTFDGKGPYKIALLAKKYHKKVIAFAGKVALDDKTLKADGFDYAMSINSPNDTLEASMDKEKAKANLKEAVREEFAAIKNVQM